MTDSQTKLKGLLRELFQLDSADLDFGIYRIMNAKRVEIERFLDNDLLPQVKKAFEQYQSSDSVGVRADIDKLIQQLRDAGVDPESAPKVKELRAKLAVAVDVSALENQVFSDLYNFFRRYYSEGDFLSLRRYKEGVYAIPYEGEEVKLYWANHDQYYIKSSEYLRDYRFKVAGGKCVHFKLTQADTEKDNNRPQNGNDRRFLLAEEAAVSEEGGELIVRFEHKPDSEKRRQDALNVETAKAILSSKNSEKWISLLTAPLPSPTDPARTVLSQHLRDFTARNTFDYFIHKEAGVFLRRELDFFIKNEVMHLDDIESASSPRVDQYLSRIKVLRGIAHKIIDFVSQLEDFQKRLWLKKKFVVETRYCVTLDRVPEKLFPEIIANKAQTQEWKNICGIHTLEATLSTVAFSEPLTPQFLKTNPSLLIDTAHFDESFRDRLLAGLGDLEEHLTGLLVRSENFQAIQLLRARFANSVQCIYIDPPYNTDASAIDYKNGYKSSSWLSLIEGRVSASRSFLKKDGVLIAAIDDEQQRELSFVLSSVFDGNVLGTICVRANPSGRPTKTGYSVSHEYLIYAGNSASSAIGRMPPTDEQMSRFSQEDEEGVFEWRNLRREGSNSDRDARRALYYPIFLTTSGSIRVPKLTWLDETEEWRIDEKPGVGETAVFPDNEDGVQKTWRWEWATVMSSLRILSVRKDRSGRDYVYYKRRPNEDGVVSVSSWFDAKYSATEHGTAVLKSLFGRSPFSYPKSIHAVVDAIYTGGAAKPHTIVFDYFGGSGTTAHAVINLNRDDNGRRKFILADMAEYFETVLVPRVKKVTFTPEWEEGKPRRAATGDEAQRVSGVIKIIRLESYEDTLNNLELKTELAQQSLLDANQSVREDYTLRYMLDVESRDNPSLLNLDAFADPFAYKLNIATGTVGETRATKVDLVETFNWLLGLRVKTIDIIKGVRVVTGTSPQGEKVLVLWRNVKEMPSPKLDDFFQKQGYNTKDMEFDVIYVNGDNNLENLKKDEDTWKVRLIEEDFKRLMFDVQDV